ncbi:condensin complex protein MksE [Methylohalobius crimeensis]|uniref:condensin complex protein MksE n=1 Tax=Methylohalobius crimeensis TaxID=244365 RepID=UPI0003B6B479|nr:hypothetical protein [Methylohalobius crimeensis]
MTDTPLALDRLTHLATLFRELGNGKHINRLSDPMLWAELEREEAAYRALFGALGYDLRLDGRGFAWFHTEEASGNVNKTSRQLALLFMVIFDTQADAGKPLLRFGDWAIDRSLLNTVHEQHQELLTAEGLDTEGLASLLETAARFGFAREAGGHWQLLPAVCRYLDHFEALAAESREASDEPAAAEDELDRDEPTASEDMR